MMTRTMRNEDEEGAGEAVDDTDDIFTSFALEDDTDEVTSSRTSRSRRIVYAVPGDPCVAENSVAILRAKAADAGVKVTLVPGVSFLEPTLAAIGADVMPSLSIVDAIDVARSAHAIGVTCDSPTLLCQLHSNAVASDAKLTLMTQFPADHPVVLVHAAGTVDEIVEHVELHEMDRSEHVGILSSAYLPAVSTGDGGDKSIGASVEALLDVVARARGGDVESEPVEVHPRRVPRVPTQLWTMKAGSWTAPWTRSRWVPTRLTKFGSPRITRIKPPWTR